MHNKLIAAVEDLLGNIRLPGEQADHAVPASEVGLARKTARGGGPLGKVLFAGQGDIGEIYGTELQLPQYVILGLTSHRLLIFQQKALTVRPKAVLHTIPFARLSWLRETTAGHSPVQVTRVTLGLTDPAVLRWEYLRLNTKAGLALNAALRERAPLAL
jgi:hypothetical protein